MVFWFNPPSLGGLGAWQLLRERADPAREQYWFGGSDNFGYLDVYDHYGLCRPRAVFGHGIHLTDDEMHVMHRTGSAISHCPTSNFFLGSGFFNIQRAMAKERPVRVGLGTDLGAGTSCSILATLNEAYKAAQLNSYALSACHAYYVATRGTARGCGSSATCSSR